MKAVRAMAITFFGALVLTATFASTAYAGCGDMSTPLSQSFTLGKGNLSLAALMRPVTAVTATAAATRTPAATGPQIVGLWHVIFTSVGNNSAPFNIPDGALLDNGYAQWHSDGTEIMNSLRDPATSNFCLGTWADLGARTYGLTHFALNWDNTGKMCTPQGGATSCFVGPVNIRQQVTVTPNGSTYDGTVSITQLTPDGHTMYTLTGTVHAERITVD
jgi:hypothetical protein